MKDHILKHCAACADHHIAMAKIHKAAEKECTGPAAEFHKSSAAAHTDAAEYFLSAYKAVDGDTSIETHDNSEGTGLKVAGNAFGMSSMRDFSKIRPDGVHGALPDTPRLVLRPGQPEIQKTSIDASTEAIDVFAK